MPLPLVVTNLRTLEDEQFVRQLGLKQVKKAPTPPYFIFADGYLGLHTTDFPKPLIFDFAGGKLGHRWKQQEGTRQPIAKAIGAKSGIRPSVLDASAGLGRDAFVMAALGCELTVIERQPVIWALLADALRRARLNAQIAEIAQRIQLKPCASALDFLTIGIADVVYFDPMYPHREKSALVKRDMRVLRDFAGDDDDGAQVLTLARECVKRVVIKRPKGAEFLGEQKPTHSIQSPGTRFDVYINPTFGNT